VSARLSPQAVGVPFAPLFDVVHCTGAAGRFLAARLEPSRAPLRRRTRACRDQRRVRDRLDRAGAVVHDRAGAHRAATALDEHWGGAGGAVSWAGSL
jgi:hypothetical protein